MPAETAARRPYLRADERRAQLLEAAAALAGREGLAALTMAGVASEAGVSRQWVHEHFSDLAGLYRALLVERFSALDADIDAQGPAEPGPELAVFVARWILDRPPDERRILRAAVDGAGGLRPELEPIEQELRERIFGRWLPVARAATHRPEAEVRALVWITVSAMFALADEMERGDLGADAAVALFRLVLTTMFREGRAAGAPRSAT